MSTRIIGPTCRTFFLLFLFNIINSKILQDDVQNIFKKFMLRYKM